MAFILSCGVSVTNHCTGWTAGWRTDSSAGGFLGEPWLKSLSSSWSNFPNHPLLVLSLPLRNPLWVTCLLLILRFPLLTLEAYKLYLVGELSDRCWNPCSFIKLFCLTKEQTVCTVYSVGRKGSCGCSECSPLEHITAFLCYCTLFITDMWIPLFPFLRLFCES